MAEAGTPATTDAATAADLYRDVVLERARRPLRDGVLDPADGVAEGSNPLCGDRTRVTLRCDAAGRLAEIRHDTRGCAICAASADLMAERAAGLDRTGLAALFGRFERMVSGGTADDELGSLAAFAELHAYASRRKCAMLPFTALLAAFGAEGEQ
ncbi:MAG: iron-sulfur cluster assembly scaffold protein [Gluconacetobacter diazotrophicus]|nr:iron-sulfur cluster assembly scaffold protein [Gluconacetobacter diazotrophicus]